MTERRVHIIGAGLAGLCTAVRLAGRGVRVAIYEGAAQAGGRCRSYFDPQLEMVIDNGNHLVLSGNRAVQDYLAAIGAADRLTGPDDARIDFVDLADGKRWALSPNEGPLPWWIFNPKRRTPCTSWRDYLGLAKLISADRRAAIGETIPTHGAIWTHLMGPFLLAALNTEPQIGAAALAGAVIRETLAKGGAYCRPRIAQPTLAAAFVEPALAYLAAKGAALNLGARVSALRFEDDRVGALSTRLGETSIPAGDAVVLAVPAPAAQELVRGIKAPNEFRAIVNAHFRLATPHGAPWMLGVIGGTAEWIFSFPDRISVTVSAGDRLLDVDREQLARTLWQDVARAHGMNEGDMPPWQIVKERRATFAATPQQARLRPGPRTAWTNLLVAGDWTDTGLPATIEGALRSGAAAADLALAALAR